MGKRLSTRFRRYPDWPRRIGKEDPDELNPSHAVAFGGEGFPERLNLGRKVGLRSGGWRGHSGFTGGSSPKPLGRVG